MKTITKTLLLIVILLLPITARCIDYGTYFEDDNGYYKFSIISDSTVAFCGLGAYYSVYPEWFDGCIPSEAECNGKTYTVTAIGQYAFSECHRHLDIEIPNTVTVIDDGAFSDCWGLIYINIPNSVTTIGDYVFYGCDNLDEITIGNSVNYIGTDAFGSCTLISRVNISDIAAWCNINFASPESNPLYYAHHLYLRNSEITNLVIPESVTTIGSYAFISCNELTGVTIPNSITTIGKGAFSRCDGITRVNITDIEAWCKINFEPDWMSSENINSSNPLIYAHHLYLNNSEVTDVTIPNTVKTIYNITFSGCTEITSLTIGNSVTSIEDYAFESCSKINSIKCLGKTPAEIIYIGEKYDSYSGVFNNCVYENATLYVPMSAIDAYMNADGWGQFQHIVGFNNYNYDYDFEADGIFYQMTSDSKVLVARDENGYQGIIAIPTSVTYEGVTYNVTGISSGAFADATLQSLILPVSIANVEDGAFDGCHINSLIITGEGNWTAGAISSESEHGNSTSNSRISYYLVGNQPFGKGWNPADGVELTQNAAGNYCFKDTVNGSVWFVFADALTESPDWNTFDNTMRIGPTAGDETIELGVWTTFQKAHGDHGAYKFTGNGSEYMVTLNPYSQMFKIDVSTSSETIIDTLFIMSTVTGVEGLQVNPTTINSYSTMPPTCDGQTFTGYDGALHVPASSLAAYFTAPYWSNFINITGDAVEPTGVTFNKDSVEVLVGNQLTLTATPAPANATPNACIWTSSDESIATVTDGVITAVKAGECDIKAYLLDKTAICHVTVTEITPTEVTLNQEFAKLEIGSQLTLTATVMPDNATDKQVTWSTTNSAVATVDSLGHVTAVGEGECFITATCRDKQAMCHVIVIDHFIYITLDEHDVRLMPNHMMTLTPTVSPANTTLVVTSSDPTVAAARMANGNIQLVGIKEGTTVITVNSTDGYAEADSCLVKVYTLRGDVNSDGFINISDVTALINRLFSGPAPTISEENADANNDGKITIADVTALINSLLSGEPLPPKDEPIEDNLTFTVNGVTFTMVTVEGGTFTMGATPEQGDDALDGEKPAHQVTLSDYAIGQTEVTQALWVAVMGTNPSRFKDRPENPVELVDWNDCQTFITQLNQLTGRQFRLPTEAEWEYAARGGNKSQGYKYAGSNNVDEVAWYSDNCNSTQPVGTKKANELGIYDMSGNVWEWCQDYYGSYTSAAQTNPTGPATGTDRIRRGVGWNGSSSSGRVSHRSSREQTYKYNSQGLRLAL